MGRRESTVSEVQNPPVRRRELGALLRALRTDAGLTVEEVAERLLCSPTKVSRMETGQRGASQRDVRDLCQIYGVDDPVEYEHMMNLAKQGRAQAWWQPFNLPYATFVGLETDALAISDFEPGVFPGLLQIPDYARAIHQGGMPLLSPTLIDQRIETRRMRQEILTRSNPPQLHAIIDEAVLHRAIGGPGVMAAQVDRVIELCESLPHLRIQLLPYSIGAHPALDSTFIILELPPPVPSVVYVEGLIGSIYLERLQDVERYQQVFERLSRIALDPGDSIDFLKRTKVQFQV
jgi:transcriptional regulator with XRE-family HTH domain